MTVAELICKLDELPQNLTIYLSSDAEGNNFANLGDVESDLSNQQVIFWPDHERLDYPEL